jgi:hypothetical protein
LFYQIARFTPKHKTEQIFNRIATSRITRTWAKSFDKSQKLSHHNATKRLGRTDTLIGCVVLYAERTNTNSHLAPAKRIPPLLHRSLICRLARSIIINRYLARLHQLEAYWIAVRIEWELKKKIF